MSENAIDEPDITKEVHFDQDNKESIVDIYVSAESLRVYENPWVEDISANTPEPADFRHTVVSENSERKNCTTDLVFQYVVYLLLLAGILALIFLGIQMKKERANWRGERNQLEADNNNLRKISDQLTANNTELSKEIDDLWRMLCEQKKQKKCKSLGW